MKKETYRIDVECGNCDFKGPLTVEKGYRLDSVECPNCGCKSIHKDFDAKKTRAEWEYRRPFVPYYKDSSAVGT